MKAEELVSSLRARGILLIADGDGLIVEPASKLTEQDRKAIRATKRELLAVITRRAAPHITPDSRNPLIDPVVRAKLESIEAEARRFGWPAELLWNPGFWDCPRGLAAVLDAEDEIAEVTPGYIAILKTHRNLLRFQRRTA